MDNLYSCIQLIQTFKWLHGSQEPVTHLGQHPVPTVTVGNLQTGPKYKRTPRTCPGGGNETSCFLMWGHSDHFVGRHCFLQEWVPQLNYVLNGCPQVPISWGKEKNLSLDTFSVPCIIFTNFYYAPNQSWLQQFAQSEAFISHWFKQERLVGICLDCALSHQVPGLHLLKHKLLWFTAGQTMWEPCVCCYMVAQQLKCCFLGCLLSLFSRLIIFSTIPFETKITASYVSAWFLAQWDLVLITVCSRVKNIKAQCETGTIAGV